MGSGGTSTATQVQQQSPEMRAFVAGTLPYLTQAQQMLPIGAFTTPQVPQVAGLSPTQQWGMAQIPGIAQSPGPQWYAPFGGGAGGAGAQPATALPRAGTGKQAVPEYGPANVQQGQAPPQSVEQGDYSGPMQGDPRGTQTGTSPGAVSPGMPYGNDAIAVDIGRLPGYDAAKRAAANAGIPQSTAGAYTPSTTAPGTAQEAGLAQLAQLTSGQVGQSPLTLAGMQAWENQQRPSIENALATMGLGRSGAGANILAQSRSQALTPLIQQEIGYRGAAVPQLFGLGQQVAGQQTTAAGLGLQAGGIEQQTAQRALDAPMQDYLRRQQLSQGLFFGVPQSTESATATTAPRQNFFGK